MKMKLWLWYVPGSEEQVNEACSAAAEELKIRNVSIAEAFAATVEANDLDESHAEDMTPGSDSVAAWYAAEFAALSRLSELTGTWPSQGSLIVLEEQRT